MSDDRFDDPMDTGVPAGVSHETNQEASFVGQGEPALPVQGGDKDTALEVAKSHMARLEEKRDREVFDEIYDLTITEPAVDVEAIACNYDGNAFFIRARFIAKHCSALRADAYIALINYLKENTKDITHYMAFFNELEAELSRKEFKNKTVNFQIPIRDSKWIEEVGSTWTGALDGLQGEYKRHKDEGVKESTRRAMEDLFQHFISAGKVEDAIRLYSRGIRDYCTQLKHSINMWLNWIEVSICANDWSKLDSITSTAYRSLKDADDSEKSNQQQQRAETATYLVERDSGSAPSSLSNRQLIETALAKCLAAQTLLKLKNKKYTQVVETILQIKTECLQPKWYVTISDLGIYAMLCAMATMKRSNLKQTVGGNGTFRKLLESEPHFIELLNSYTSSRFGKCFEIMNSVKNRLLLDPFISKNVEELFSKIRQKCVVQYLQPYSTVKMETMCTALGATFPELQNSLLELIENKSVVLKIDQSAGIIRMVDETDEETTLRRVNETCDRTMLRARSLLWKSTMSAANIHSVSDKETRQKRKNQKDMRLERSIIDVDDGPSGGIPDDFHIGYDNSQHFLEDLGDI
ncbi:CBN-CSN-1 protein [Caenorhabditis brenneri]|uniref:CBN-CSN-1 protein n=1 Tax=Caenorhabditis brenneri TaxID=135651 RepID=G0N0N6_CAEBE|nr:CBN-CSN-1 protein [Caenorhabditis brenneri]